MFGMIQLFLLIMVCIFHGLVHVTSLAYNSCYHERCPSGLLIGYPFWRADNKTAEERKGYYCGYPGFSISCGGEGRPSISLSNHTYYVQTIDYINHNLRVVDVDVDGHECPQPRHNLSLESTPLFYQYYGLSTAVLYSNCSHGMEEYPEDLKQHIIPCLNHVDVQSNQTRHSFLFDADHYDNGSLIIRGGGVFNWYEHCQDAVEIPYPPYSEYRQSWKLGFYLGWNTPADSEKCETSGGRSYFNETTREFHCFCGWPVYESVCPHQNQTTPPKNGMPFQLKIIIGVSCGVGASVLIVLLIYSRALCSTCCLVRSTSNVEVFLENCGSLAPQRYRYSDIKKMTNSFKEILGQGGFGSVFKGKLSDCRFVAVKVLNDSKSNGEDFINEVATISRTNHVNVVNLLGFCSEGKKRALVYEFMPNGSLEKFIYNATNSSTSGVHLGLEKLYQIALGIAKGLEYLHRGCNTRILHFDIKPHNILLDENFCPKISDFGLAKLCPTKESVVSMLVGRGTFGYTAPEVHCRNFGGVSHKSDVYSYGMMVLEMIGGRKNLDVSVENMSEIYFPQWIYNHFKLDVSVDGCGEIFEDKTARKMITAALWCIQTQPASRPSMSRVVEMLEGNIEEVQMPPNPFHDPSSSSSP